MDAETHLLRALDAAPTAFARYSMLLRFAELVLRGDTSARADAVLDALRGLRSDAQATPRRSAAQIVEVNNRLPPRTRG